MFAWIASTVVGQLIKGAFGFALGWLTQRQTRADELELGQKQQVAVDDAAALEAHKRMDKAAAMPSDTAKGLQDGTF